MKVRNSGWALFGALLLSAAGLAQADTLIGVLPTTPGGTDYQAYYDSTTNLTWLADAGGNGLMDWLAATNWAASLNISGVTGWTLPTSDTCVGYNCTGSQLGYLFYDVLGGQALQSIATTHNSNYNLFTNVQSYYYWSATEYAPDTDNAWLFDFSIGNQLNASKFHNYLYAWAVHVGDVGAPPSVPEPGALSLMLMGLATVGFASRRRFAFRSLE